jgi:hypothetical protein
LPSNAGKSASTAARASVVRERSLRSVTMSLVNTETLYSTSSSASSSTSACASYSTTLSPP